MVSNFCGYTPFPCVVPGVTTLSPRSMRCTFTGSSVQKSNTSFFFSGAWPVWRPVCGRSGVVSSSSAEAASPIPEP